MKQDFTKLKIVIRYWLLGRGYYKAVEAMDFAEAYHTGSRKDGEHEFSHQVRIANYMRCFDTLMEFPEETFCAIFLHDVPEDYEVTFEEIEKRFGPIVGKAVYKLSKVRDGIKISNDKYYSEMVETNESSSQVTSLAKAGDRIDNLMTMLGGFSAEKQISYIEETLEFVVPMVKRAKRMFPKQEGIFENMKYIIANHVKMYTALNQHLITV